MDRPEQPDHSSIFKRPDPELEDDFTVRRSAEPPADDGIDELEPSTTDGPIPPRYDPLYPRGRAASPQPRLSRPMLVGIAGGGLLALVAAGFIVMNVFGGRGSTAAAASPTPSATSAASAEPDASVEPSATPVPTPPPAPVALANNQWATIITDGVNVRKEPSASAEVVGGANRGEIVMIDGSQPVEADGFDFYRAIVSPGVAGWVAAHDETAQFVLSDAPTTSVRWCAIPDRPSIEVDDARGETRPLDVARIGGLSVSTDVLGPAGTGIVELAWGTQDQVCLDLAITDGRTVSTGITATMEGCGSPSWGAAMMVQFGTGAVDESGNTDSRRTVLDPTVLGFEPLSAGQNPNLVDVYSLAGMGGTGEQALCIEASASGPAKSPSIAFSAGTTQCAWVSSRTSSAIELSYPDGGMWVELRITPDSFVGEGVTAQTHSWGAQKGFRVSAERGVDGSLGISVRAMEGCGS